MKAHSLLDQNLARPSAAGAVNPPLPRLGAYLAMGLGTGALATSAEAAIISIDVSSLTGVNAGLSAGGAVNSYIFPGGRMFVSSTYGFFPTSGLSFQYPAGGIAAGSPFGTPHNFAAGALAARTLLSAGGS